jgi:hypothetical protein
MSRRDVSLDAGLRHLGAAYYDWLHGRAAPADVSRALGSVAGHLGEEPIQHRPAARPPGRRASRCPAAARASRAVAQPGARCHDHLRGDHRRTAVDLPRRVAMDVLTAGARAGEIAGPAGRNRAGTIAALRAVTGKGPRPRLRRLGLAAALIAALGLGAAWAVTASAGARVPPVTAPDSGASQHAHSPPQPLIDICQQAPCANGQELEIFDQGRAPIFSVGEAGGASVFGDNLRVWAPGTSLLAGTAAVTLSWESPGEYDHQFKLADGCTPPAMWESPHAIWACTSSHKWKIALRF